MKNLHNALLLKQLTILKQIGYSYTDLKPSDLDQQQDIELPSNLPMLKKSVLACHMCQLSKTRSKAVFGEGNSNAKLMFVGEAPGMSEDSIGKPFVGRAGELLTKMIENVLFVSREDVYISNIVKCRPPNNRTPTESEAHTCRPYLQREIELVKPKIIVALGSTAYKYLSNDNSPISKVRGSTIEMDGYIMIPTYHPSYLLRNPSAKKEAMQDLLKIKELL